MKSGLKALGEDGTLKPSWALELSFSMIGGAGVCLPGTVILRPREDHLMNTCRALTSVPSHLLFPCSSFICAQLCSNIVSFRYLFKCSLLNETFLTLQLHYLCCQLPTPLPYFYSHHHLPYHRPYLFRFVFSTSPSLECQFCKYKDL